MNAGGGAASGAPTRAPAPTEVLRRGDIQVHGRIAGSSNATMLVTCTFEGCDLLAVYKPVRGERELWDFPPGLHRREVAAAVVADALGWRFVPETVVREDAPFGTGSLQRVVDEDGESHYFTLREEPRWHPLLMTMAAFDVAVNNADRKSGHVLLAEGTLWAIDHGLTFHVEPKLRTVVWDFAGDPLPPEVLSDLCRFARDPLPAELEDLLTLEEREALVQRVERLAEHGRLPTPRDGRPYPWPLV